jgi:glycerophosphoryl diester phosphodiesterase
MEIPGKLAVATMTILLSAIFNPKLPTERLEVAVGYIPFLGTLRKWIGGLSAGWFPIGLYCLLVYVFMRVPLYRITHQESRKAQLIAHRGGRRERDDLKDVSGRADVEDSTWPPENSMAAFVRSISDADILADGLQMEVQVTKDGVPVIFHSDDMTEATGESIKVQQTDYADLPNLIVSEKARQDVGKRHGLKSTHYDTIPTLEQVFEKFPNTLILLDLRSDDTRLLDACDELVKKHDRERITVWGSGRMLKVNDELYKRNPKVPLLFNKRGIQIATISYYLSLLPWIPLKPSVFLFPAKKMLLNRNLLKHLHARGITIIIYGDALHQIDTLQMYQKSRSVGAKTICADRPRLARSFLERVEQN